MRERQRTEDTSIITSSLTDLDAINILSVSDNHCENWRNLGHTDRSLPNGNLPASMANKMTPTDHASALVPSYLGVREGNA
jgi:hypothetical protein